MANYTENLEKLREDMKEIKREIKISSFDTIYSSVLVLGIGGILSIILTTKPNEIPLWTPLIVFLGVSLAASLLMEFFSLFFRRDALKMGSIFSLWFMILFLGIIYSFVIFPVKQPFPLFSIRNIITALTFVILALAGIILIKNYFE